MRVFLLMLTCALAGSASAGTVYRWTDSQGITHYSDSKPLRGVNAEVKGSYRLSTQSTPATPAVQPENPRCEDARRGITALEQNGIPVRMDLDGDGTPEPLDNETRARQLELARAQAKAFCTL
jgi:hypothetical protein